MKNYEELRFQLETKIKSYQSSLDDFKENFDKDPAYALEWSNGTFKNAAFMGVDKTILNWVNLNEKNGVSFEAAMVNMKEVATTQALNEASSVALSTSQVSNLMKDYTRQAWAHSFTDLVVILEVSDGSL